MSKNYDLSKKSDMRRFMKDLEKEAFEIGKESISKNGLDIECPHCGKEIHAPLGLSTCPKCGGEINLSFQ